MVQFPGFEFHKVEETLSWIVRTMRKHTYANGWTSVPWERPKSVQKTLAMKPSKCSVFLSQHKAIFKHTKRANTTTKMLLRVVHKNQRIRKGWNLIYFIMIIRKILEYICKEFEKKFSIFSLQSMVGRHSYWILEEEDRVD